MLKLWLLEPRCDSEGCNPAPWRPWYDKAFGFVVRAENEELARRAIQNPRDEDDCMIDIPSEERHRYAGDEGVGAWRDPNLSSCVEIGIATGVCHAGVVLRHYGSA